MFLQNYRNTSGIENLRALILLKPVRLFYFVHASVQYFGKFLPKD